MINQWNRDLVKEISKIGTLIKNQMCAGLSFTVVVKVTRIVFPLNMPVTISANGQVYRNVSVRKIISPSICFES